MNFFKALDLHEVDARDTCIYNFTAHNFKAFYIMISVQLLLSILYES